MSSPQQGVTITQSVHFARQHRGRKVLRQVVEDEAPEPAEAGRVPRVSRLMALAIRCEELIRKGLVKDQAEIATLGHVSRARVTQIMNLLHLAPDIQEQILFLPRVGSGGDPIREPTVRPIAAETEWGKQRRMWRELLKCLLDR